MILNQYDATKSYTALILHVFSNLQLKIDDAGNELYTIPILYANASRLYKKLANNDDSFTYRTPIMSLETNIDTEIALSRATNPILKRRVVDLGGNSITVTYNDKPTDYIGTITIVADTMTTLTNIVEGINSMFYHNTLYATYKTPLGEEIRTPIKLENIDMSTDNNADVYEDKRLLEAIIELRVEGLVHSNYNTNAKEITQIDLYIDDYTVAIDNIIEHYTIVP